jgi:hypothetical protein
LGTKGNIWAYFSNSFWDDCDKVTFEENMLLIKSFTEDEIKQAIF